MLFILANTTHFYRNSPTSLRCRSSIQLKHSTWNSSVYFTEVSLCCGSRFISVPSSIKILTISAFWLVYIHQWEPGYCNYHYSKVNRGKTRLKTAGFVCIVYIFWILSLGVVSVSQNNSIYNIKAKLCLNLQLNLNCYFWAVHTLGIRRFCNTR